MKIQVTREDIDRGKSYVEAGLGSPTRYCPIAQAIKRITNILGPVFVINKGCVIGANAFLFNQSTRNIIAEFDYSGEMEPFEFELTP